jgi:hypothetical protein
MLNDLSPDEHGTRSTPAKFPFSDANRTLRAALAKLDPPKPKPAPKPEIPGASEAAIRRMRRPKR